MATTTPHLSLRKPASSDVVNVTTDISDNMDKLDTAIKDLDDDYLTPRPFWHVYQATAQTGIANSTDTAVTFDAEHEETTGAGHSNTVNPSRITPGILGLYRAVGQVAFAANTTGDRAGHFRVNGNKVNWRSAYTGNPAVNGTSFVANTVLVATTFRLTSVSDYVELWCSQNSGGALDLFASASFTTSWFMLEYIGKP